MTDFSQSQQKNEVRILSNFSLRIHSLRISFTLSSCYQVTRQPKICEFSPCHRGVVQGFDILACGAEEKLVREDL
jgi:hypothetical protein